MKFFICAVIITTSFQALASIECENTLIAHFKKIKINPDAKSITQDYLHPTQNKLSECAYKAESLSEMNALIKAAKKLEVSDSRRNEAIRVCTAISAFAYLGLDEKQIESKITSFENGWSEGMRAPLKNLIKSEIAANETNVGCSSISSSNSGRDILIEKSGAPKMPKEENKRSRTTKQ